jgi:hypothetical protein
MTFLVFTQSLLCFLPYYTNLVKKAFEGKGYVNLERGQNIFQKFYLRLWKSQDL